MDDAEPRTTVQIIQNPGNTGLAAAFFSAHFSYKTRRKASSTQKYSSLMTNTAVVVKETASSQNRHAHYVSSYQLAYCRLKPRYPLREFSEFPLQRATPNQTRGHFVVGTRTSEETTSFKTKRLRSSYSFCRCSAVVPDSFVDSLRKYPMEGRSASTELVQLLLSCTQAKYSLSRNYSRNKRSIYLFPRASKHKNKQISKASKNLQTYKRMNNETPAVKDRISRRERVKTLRREKEKFINKNATRSVDATTKSNVTTDQLKESLDRLEKSAGGISSYAGRYAEVRFINEMKRCVQEVIRQINDGPVTPCANIERCFRDHRSLHQEESYNMACSSIEDCYGERRRILPWCDIYNNPRDCHQAIENYHIKKSLPCGVPSNICDCDDISWNDLKRYLRNTLRKIFARTPKQTIPCPRVENRYREHRRMYHRKDSATSPCSSKERFDDEDDTWSREGKKRKYKQEANPEDYDVDRQNDREKSDKSEATDKYGVADKSEVTDKSRVADKGEATDKKEVKEEVEAIEYEPVDIKEQVMLWLINLPAYYDNTEENKATTLNMVPEFVSALQDANDKPDREDRVVDEAQKFLKKIPVDDDSEEEEDEYDEVKEFIQLWLEVTDFDLTTKAGNMIPKEQLLNSLMCRLEPIVRHSGKGDELKTEVLAVIPEYKNGLKDDINFANQIRENADNLVNALKLLIKQKADKRRKRIRSKFLQPILKWLNGTENNEVSEDVKMKLKQSATRSELKLEEMMTENVGNKEIVDELENFLGSIPQVEFSDEQKSQLAAKVLEEIRVPTRMSNNQKKRHAKVLMEKLEPEVKNKSGG